MKDMLIYRNVIKITVWEYSCMWYIHMDIKLINFERTMHSFFFTISWKRSYKTVFKNYLICPRLNNSLIRGFFVVKRGYNYGIND